MSAHTIEAILTAKDQGFTSTFDKAQQKAQSFGDKIKSGLGFGMLMRAGQKAFDVIGNSIATNMDGAIKRFDTLRNYPKVMQSLGYSAEDADASIKTLGDNISYLPTTLDKVASQTQQVVAVVGDLGKATDLTLALNNAMASGGAPAEQQASAINQWVQAMAKGKPDLQDWRALVQTAPAQMNQLAEAMLGAGKSQTDLYQAMQDGSVSIEEVNDAMIKLSQQGADGITAWSEQAKSAGGGINMALTNIKASIQRNLANGLEGLNTRLEEVGGISGVLQSVIPSIDAVGTAISGVLSGDLSFEDAMTGLLNSISARLPEFITKGADMVLNLVMGIAQSLPTLITNGLNALTNFVQGLGQGNGQLISKAVDIVVTLVGGLIKATPQILSAGVRLIVALISGISSAFGSLLSKVGALAKRIPTAIKTGVGNLVGIGRNLIEGLWNGIKAKFDGVIAKVKALASKLPKAVKKVLGIASPSKVMYRLGEFTGEGFANGIEAMNRQVETASTNLVTIPRRSAMGFGTDLAYEYGYTGDYSIEVPLYLNGREIARASASDMQTILNQRETRASRKVGIR